MILLPIIALIIGAALALLFRVGPISGLGGQYMALSCLAGLDTICGGIRSGLEGKFRNDVFFTGFASNMVIAFGLAWLGDQIYINLWFAVALVLGTRIFSNLSLIRRYALTQVMDSREKKRQQAASALANPTPDLNP